MNVYRTIPPKPEDWPDDDDWERITCGSYGVGHRSCGWCYEHGHPRFVPCPPENE